MNEKEFWDQIKALSPDAPIPLLFICSGNICRSPYMELRFKDLLQKSAKIKNKDRFIITSGGFVTQRDLAKGHPFTLKALIERGVPENMVNAFESRHLRRHKEEMERAITLITPSEKTNPLVPNKHQEKIVFLSDISLGYRKETEDPVQIQDYLEYKKHMDELEEMLVALIEKFENIGI